MQTAWQHHLQLVCSIALLADYLDAAAAAADAPAAPFAGVLWGWLQHHMPASPDH
jgi:hypothetical protein